MPVDLIEAGNGALRSVLEQRFPIAERDRLDVLARITPEDCALAYQRLRVIFRRPPRKGRPRAMGKHQTLYLLGTLGMLPSDARKLVDAAGLKGPRPRRE